MGELRASHGIFGIRTEEVALIGKGSFSAAKKGFAARRLKLAAWVMVALAFSFTLSITPVRSEVTVAVTPTRIPLSVAPMETRDLEVTLINQGTEEVELRPRVMALEEGEGGEPLLKENGRCEWFTAQAHSLRLEPSRSGPFVFSVTVPSGVEHGMYRFALTFELEREEGAGIGLTGGLAVIVDLEVLEGGAGGAGRFPTAAVIITAVLAALLLGAVAFMAIRRRRCTNQGEVAGSEGG